MDFTFSPEQEELRGAVRAALAGEAPPAVVRGIVDDDSKAFPDDLWRTFADLGWLGVLVPAAHGGLGLGLIDAVVVQEEMGRVPLPGPYFSSAVLATLAAVRLGADALLGDLASGARRGTVAVEEWGSGDPLASVATTATRAGDRWVLDGLKPLVLDASGADWVIVVARDTSAGGDGALAGFLVESPVASVVPSLDVTRTTCRLELDGVGATRLGPDGDQTALWRRVLDDASVALCAETLGACEAAQQMAVDYSIQRVQFDRPIGSFQVIRHKLVDMLHRLTLAQVGVHWAAWASDVDDPEREHAAAMCKGFLGDASVFVTAENIQVHGGVGFTWDVDAHLYYRRVKQNDALLGANGWQRARLADLVLGEPLASR
jgi:alkylation response protein AidB-like acyl-CoA dehydrogenase